MTAAPLDASLSLIADWLETHRGDMHPAPATPADIERLSQALGTAVPAELVSVLTFPRALAIFEYAMIPPGAWKQNLARKVMPPSRASFASRRWFPLAEDGGGNLCLVDLSSTPAVIRRWERGSGQVSSESRSIPAFFAHLALALGTGRFRFDPVSGFLEGPFVDLLADPVISGDSVILGRMEDLDKLPLGVSTARLPPDAGPRRCLFFMMSNPWSRRMFKAVPEQDMDHVEQGMEIAGEVFRFLRKTGLNFSAFGTTASSGFHASSAEPVEAWLRSAGAEVLPLGLLLAACDLDCREQDRLDAAYQPVYARLRAEATLRHGYLPDRIAKLCGLTDTLLEHALRRGYLLRVAEGVLRLMPGSPSPHESILLSFYASGENGLVSHESALALHGLCELRAPLHLTFAPGATTHPQPGVVFHAAHVPTWDRTWVGGLPVTTLLRSLQDCRAAGMMQALEQAQAAAPGPILIPHARRAPKPHDLRDPRLRLALLEALIPPEKLRKKASTTSPEALLKWAFQQAIPEEPAERPLEHLVWSKEATLWRAILPGEDGLIRELKGLESYNALAILDLPESQLLSLEPLRTLEALVAVRLVITPSASLEPLLALLSLKRVLLRGVNPKAHQEDLQALEARGVVVDRWDPLDPKASPLLVSPR
ncbi:MAG: hypothetical protein MUF64_19945 [Polyangiaceae bacterium]|nr:hypothetical protein [Polyangiaceae bacterium]